MIKKAVMNQIVQMVARALGLSAVLLCNGCAVIAVADAAVSVSATVVKTSVKVAGAAINAVIPD